jgi:hypothetical protein
MTTDPSQAGADPLDDLLSAQRANRAETARQDSADANESAAALAAALIAKKADG